jgi:hypothetical protein
VADRRGNNNAEADFGDARRGDVKGVPGIERRRDAHNNGGVTAEDEAIGAKVPCDGEVPRVFETKSAKADP